MGQINIDILIVIGLVLALLFFRVLLGFLQLRQRLSEQTRFKDIEDRIERIEQRLDRLERK